MFFIVYVILFISLIKYFAVKKNLLPCESILRPVELRARSSFGLRRSPPGLAILPLTAKECSSVPFVKNHTPPGLAIGPLTPNGPLSANGSAKKIASNSGAISG